MNLYPFGKAVTYPLVHLLFKVRYEGLENIPKNSGFILASNHRSNFDPLFVAHKVPNSLHFMAKIELFKNPLIGWILRSVNAFAVDRGKGDNGAINHAIELLSNQQVLSMFPEGSRSKTGKLGRARSGVALIAQQTGADVLPCAVVFGEKLRFRTPVTVRYGTLISSQELDLKADSPSSIRTGAKKIMDAIAALLAQDEGDGVQ